MGWAGWVTGKGSGMVAHCEGPGWKGAVAAEVSLFPVVWVFFWFCWGVFCSFVCGLCKQPWCIYLCPSQQGLPLLWTSEQITGWSELLTDDRNLTRGTGCCQVGMNGTAACVGWAWAPSGQGGSRYGSGKGSWVSSCPQGHLALQPQLFLFLLQKWPHFLSLRQENYFLHFLSHATLEFCCLMHKGPAPG